MNTIRLRILALSTLLCLGIASAAIPAVSAQESELETPTTQMQDSGYTDENGQPISPREYDQKDEQNTKTVFERYPIPTMIAAIAIVTGTLYLITKKRSNTKAR